MIMQDRSTVSVVTCCTDCPHWQAFSFTLDEARVTAANHLIRVHGTPPHEAASSIRQAATRRERHAEARS